MINAQPLSLQSQKPVYKTSSDFLFFLISNKEVYSKIYLMKTEAEQTIQREKQTEKRKENKKTSRKQQRTKYKGENKGTKGGNH